MSSDQSSAWSAFGLNKQLLNGIADAAFEAPTEVQARVFPLIRGGQEVVGIAPTGTGKTAAYLLPLLQKLGYAKAEIARALILAPTKELVIQIAAHATVLAKYTGLRIIPLYGGIGPRDQIAALRTGVDIIVATPGRFMELYQKKEIEVKQLLTLVLDEADRMLDMGFMPQLRRLFEVIPQRRQNLLFSATFSDKVAELSEEFIEFPVRVEVAPPATVTRQVDHELYKIPNLKTKINFLEYLLNQSDVFTRVMIFARTKEVADNVGHFVERKSLGPVRVIHSNKGQNSRINAVNEFRSGTLRVLVATDVAARGLDISDVSHVINFDVPGRSEDYVHRIGRTGRAFRVGQAITFVNPAEEFFIQKIESLIREKIPVRQLPATIAIAETLFEESQEMAREIDRQRKLEDPDFKGAFHSRS